MDREWLSFLREQYPIGSRIILHEMNDPYAPIESGMTGTLDCIDDKVVGSNPFRSTISRKVANMTAFLLFALC